MKSEKDDGLINQNTDDTAHSPVYYLLLASLVVIVGIILCFVFKAALIGILRYLMRNVH